MLQPFRLASGDVPIDRYTDGLLDMGLVSAAGVPLAGSGNAGVLDAASGTLQVSNDGITWTAALRGDTGAAITALSATNIPFAMNWRYMRCTAGTVTIRALIGTT
jgi:hypothetical protein